MSAQEFGRTLAFAKELADPDWSLSVPKVAKDTIRKLVAVIEAAQPRIITTIEELDALPRMSVILDRDGDAWQRCGKGWTCTDRATNTVDQPSSSLVHVLGPATVLSEPAA